MKKTIKIIDLYVKIANDEEVPKAIKYSMYEEGHNIFIYDEEEKEYANDEEYLIVPNHHLNDEVEIIEEHKLDMQKIQQNIERATKEFYEAWQPVKKQFAGLFDILQKNKLLEEDKKIEKLIEPITLGDIHENLISMNKIASKVNELIYKINSLEKKNKEGTNE